jgi:N-acetylmuramoyl-L-alanine amidase
MIKKTTTLLVLCGTAFGFTSFNKSPIFQKPMLRTIVIDPGHGGFDPGTHGLLVKEKDVALGISLKLGRALQQAFPGIRIVYTRTTDIMPGNKPTLQEGIRYRAELANRSNGDLYICIHCNSNGRAAGSYAVKHLVRYRAIGKGRNRRSVPVYATTWVKNVTRGTTTYIWKADRNLKKGAAVDAELRNGENMGDSTGSAYDYDDATPEAMMRAQLYEKKYFANSALFGTLVEDEFARTGRRSYGVQQRPVGIGVLEATGMPSVLIETGYLTNRDEERYLASNRGQNEVARGIVNALKRYQLKIQSE